MVFSHDEFSHSLFYQGANNEIKGVAFRIACEVKECPLAILVIISINLT